MPSLLFRTFIELLISVSAPLIAKADLLFSENNASDGNFQQDHTLLPTQLGSLPLGVSTIFGVVSGLGSIGSDVDIFSLVVDEGTALTKIEVPSYSGDPISFMAITSGPMMPFGPNEFRDSFTGFSEIIGVAQFGTGWFRTSNALARDLLTSNDSLLTGANRIGNRFVGTKPFATYGATDKFDELPAGVYTFYVQNQQPPSAEYTMAFTVVSVPEPSSLTLVGLIAVTTACVRRRRAASNS